MTRPVILAALALLTACATTPTPEQRRARCEAERTRHGISRLLPPETRQSPDCAPASR
jgi:hypothetical protein